MNDEQLELDFTPGVCVCSEATKYEDLCPTCLNDCLEYMTDSNCDEWETYEHA